MQTCAHSNLELSLDRWQECHWYLHQMEANYHEPEPFRYSCNSFLRAVKEVPQALSNDLQRHPGEKAKIKPLMDTVSTNVLLHTLGKRRDFVVHHGSLHLKSHGRIGTTEGATIKVVFPFAVYPSETSDEAYERYKTMCKTNKMLRGFGPDCDSAPALWRTWMIPQFPGRDLLDVAVEAWELLGELLSGAIEAFGGDKLDLSLPCRHDPAQVQIKRFSQYEFFLTVDGIDLKEEARKWREQKARGD
ncbi:hypothetical protein [Paraburkholderia humisilvae]|uniref:Uncharacterized protein n=1 Tax=Paraburkholderia humisilvae TaxID=627669 RepID=A0A6J5DL27_9BURK|nr:hypothetical protein [Paraburkholderia humisilvae]CAB3754788.1 hypothetical protein LMG29542_02454 [Paraburkholderia humisilvae]